MYLEKICEVMDEYLNWRLKFCLDTFTTAKQTKKSIQTICEDNDFFSYEYKKFQYKKTI